MNEDTFRPPASPTVAKQSREAEVEEAAQLSRRTSSGSVSSSSTPSSPTRSPRPSPLQQPNAATSPLTSPIKRTSPYSYTPSSPLSSVDSRRRQDSISSSGTTEATSVEESGGEDNMSGDGDGKEGSSSSSGTWSASGSKRIPQHSLLAPSSTNTTLVNNNSGSSPSSSVTNAIPIPLSSSNSNISLSTSLPASSVRLSTTPLFPSPLAQASGPDEDHVKGDDGDGESEEEEGLWDLQRIGKDSSALSRMHSVPFDGSDMSPVLATVALPDTNSLGLEPAVTPRASTRSEAVRHRRSLSGRDSSPETDGSRTARAIRVHSLGRASGSATTPSSPGEESALSRRRSRTSDLSVFTPGSPTGSTGFHRSLPPQSPGGISPSVSPTTLTAANTISRRASINLLSPPRYFSPSLPPTSRPSRSSLSAAFALGIPAPTPVPPPPVESIKLTKVPEAVRSAMDFRLPSGISYLGETSPIPGSGLPIPKTPSGTRAPSPVSGSGSGSLQSDTIRSHPPSQQSSRAPSRAHSRERLALSPVTSPVHIPGHSTTPSTGSSSAFSPLFPFPSAPANTNPTRNRARSVYLPSSASPSFSLNSDPFREVDLPPLGKGLKRRTMNDLGGFLGSPGYSPQPHSSNRKVSDSDYVGHIASTSVGPQQAQGFMDVRRTSVFPGDSGEPSQSTDDYAQIILASRSAKMRKWKTSTTSTIGVGAYESGKMPGREALIRNPVTPFDEEDVKEADSTPEATPEFGLGGQVKEIEWVDWLDEYRKMKEAKLRAEQAAAAKTPKELTSEEKGKGRDMSPLEYNPFEATTAHINYKRTGFLTPATPASHFPMFPVSGGSFEPKPTAVPSSSRSLSQATSNSPGMLSASSAVSSSIGSPGLKRKRNFNKLGSKIDTWWSAVRTSFSIVPEEEKDGGERRRPSLRPISTQHISPPPAVRALSHLTRPTTPSELLPPLRNAASAQDLTTTERPFRFVPAGALAPAARVLSSRNLVPPPFLHSGSSGSDASSESLSTKADSRRRNPHLSLNFGDSFNSMLSPRPVSNDAHLTFKDDTRLLSPHGGSIASASDASSPSVPPNESSSGHPFSHTMQSFGMPTSRTEFTPALTPGHPSMWDQTPGLLPTSLAPQSPSIPADARTRQEARAAAVSSFSMNTVRQHIQLRLSTAKENCDKELKRIVQGITAHVEVELQKESMLIRTPYNEEGGSLDLVGDADGPYGPYSYPAFEDSESDAPAEADGGEDGVHTDSDGGTSRPTFRSRHSSSPNLTPFVPIPGRNLSVTALRTGSPRSQTSLIVRKRQLTSATRHPDFSTYSFGEKSRSTPDSLKSSRSNSRSRSPLPVHSGHLSPSSRSPSRSSKHGSSLPGGLAQSAFIVLLQEIITVAAELLDTPITKLTSRSGSCAEYIQRVQVIGKAWDDNPELPCRGWYVQLLLAVAGLSRVVEWWEAERGFWTFEEADEEDVEPIVFVAKTNADSASEMRNSVTGPLCLLPSKSANTGQSPTQKDELSPLGIDLGDQSDLHPERLLETGPPATEEDTKKDADDLRMAVEQIRSQTLLMELSLDGQLFQYLSSAWQELVGIEGGDCLDSPIADFLYPDDAAVFAEATRQLEADDSHTVEVSFRLRVASSSSSSNDEESPEDLYEVMEGKGMLMLDGVSGGPSHTMWVIRPAPYTSDSFHGHVPEEALGRHGLEGYRRRTRSDPSTPFPPSSRMAESILCRICERPTPAWFFEKHNETCNETHRLESDISECNDRLKETARTIEEISTALEQSDNTEVTEYRGIPLLTSSSESTSPSYFEGNDPPQSRDLYHQESQHLVLRQVSEIVRAALEISMPSVLDDICMISIQDQPLLSPNSEDKLAFVMRWQRPIAEEAALIRLVTDTEEQTRFKVNSINRLRNTILYAEKVRQEWEAKANAALSAAPEDTWAANPSPFDSPMLQPLQDSPMRKNSLDLPQSHSFFPVSPLLSPEDLAFNRLGSPIGATASLVSSPRIPAGVPAFRTKASSIKDFKILKPISKGAFGSVYLAKKITTGDYYAIKVLKKSDMIAKNQVTNVKAERMILMTQTESDFVVKLFYTFQSKDYLYLVMEYLNGGDCAALIKNMGELPEEWTRKYIAEVVVGLEYLHSSGIIHRDLKPDNLLIDLKGHLKLTDFGLSRIGLLGRQTRIPSSRDPRRPHDASLRSSSHDFHPSETSSPSSTPANPLGASQMSYFGSLAINDSFSLDTPESESSGSNSLAASHKNSTAALESMTATRLAPSKAGAATCGQKNFVGTPDYLAPESILGIGMDVGVDWWALGVICYEFLYGFPPFHDDTPEIVFANILSRKIDWHEEEIEISPEARDFMERLLCSDANRRLGKGGAAEVKAHPFLAGISWDNLLTGEVDFIPKISDPESTDYFDPRGATAQVFNDDDDTREDERLVSPEQPLSSNPIDAPLQTDPLAATIRRAPRERSETEPSPHEDFGAFNFRNLPVLKQANDDVIRKMRDEQLLPPLALPLDSAGQPRLAHQKFRSGSNDFGVPSTPSSPSTTSNGSNILRHSVSSTPQTSAPTHSRYVSEQQPGTEGLRPRQSSVTIANLVSSEHSRRNSLPSRLRKASLSDYERPAASQVWREGGRRRPSNLTPPASQLGSPMEDNEQIPLIPLLDPPLDPRSEVSVSPQPLSGVPTAPPPVRINTIDCLIAGRNPISNKVLETILVRLGCRCVVVPDGAEAILAAGGVKFDLIWMDLQMPIVDGEKAARMIKSTNNPSSTADIVAVCSYSIAVDDEVGTLFAATLPKPTTKEQVLAILRKLGFQEKRRGDDESRRGSNEVA